MENKFLFLTMISVISLLFGCSKSSEDEFNNANGDIPEKYIKHFQIIDNTNGNRSYTINYGTGNKVSSITDGNTNAFLNYDESNNLNSVVSDNETLDIDELYQSPYDAFEAGNVLEYDDNANPIKIEVYDGGYGSDISFGDIIYDPNPNPFFYTLKAAGVIDVLDRVDLNFGYSNPAIIKARLLLPYNNIRAMIFKDASGITISELQIDYIYGDDKYPISANVNIMSENESLTYSLIYTYK